MKVVTREDCERLREKFREYTERAEQHEFAKLLSIHLLLDKTWEDLDSQLKNNQPNLRTMFRVVYSTIGDTKTAKEYEEE